MSLKRNFIYSVVLYEFFVYQVYKSMDKRKIVHSTNK